MRIAILVPNFTEYSGDALVVRSQAKDLIEGGNDVTIFALDSNIKPENVKLSVIGMPKSLFWQRVYRLIFPVDLPKTCKWLPRLKDFDLIISHLYPMNWLAFLAKKFYGVEYVYWYHGIPYPRFYSRLYEKIYLYMFILLTRFTVGNADSVVSVSGYAQREFRGYTGLDSEVVYNKPDLERFHEGMDGSEIREKYNLGDDPVILNIGRVCPQKGAHLLIKAFRLVKQEIYDAKLMIVGKHTYDYYSRELREETDDSVIFVDFVHNKELPRYYAACDIYVTCSLWETFNLPLVEAQACGKPVVAFDIGSHPEVINEKGILVEENNVEKCAEACIEKLREVRVI